MAKYVVDVNVWLSVVAESWDEAFDIAHDVVANNNLFDGMEIINVETEEV